MIVATFPYPPGVNHYYTVVHGRKILSKRGREYKQSLTPHVGNPLTGRLAVTISLQPPDRRRRDIDGPIKGLLDALQYAGYYEDDSQIDRLVIARHEPIDGGAVGVMIEEVRT